MQDIAGETSGKWNIEAIVYILTIPVIVMIANENAYYIKAFSSKQYNFDWAVVSFPEIDEVQVQMYKYWCSSSAASGKIINENGWRSFGELYSIICV